ncbi:hypothetical protein BSNT_06546 [Bacillus subtilis subsp. natto BEST195]|nr:hypothetical protein BSNT_06546 [Bacillus subtilis subsp. natto BEST195]
MFKYSVFLKLQKVYSLSFNNTPLHTYKFQNIL